MKPVSLFCAALSLGLFLLNLTGCGSGGGRARGDKLLTTTEVKQQVMGKTKNEVVRLLGQPDTTQVEWGSDGSSANWTFRDAAIYPEDGKPTDLYVRFEKWVVVRVGAEADGTNRSSQRRQANGLGSAEGNRLPAKPR